MFITSMNIENFGPFFERRFNNIPGGLTLIYGPNETGKSAIRAFIRMVFFGTLRRNSKEYDFYNYPPVRGGTPSGSITVQNSAGRAFTIHRGTNGRVTVTGDESGGEELLNELTGRISPNVYQNIFSISLSELQSFESMDNDQVRDRIYSAGLGLSTVSLPEASKRLTDDIGKLWSPRSGRLRAGFNELNEQKTNLERARSEMHQYEILGNKLAGKEQEISDARSNLTDLRTKLGWQERLIGLLPQWAKQAELMSRINDLPRSQDFPIDGLEQANKLNAEVNSLNERVAEGDAKHEARQREKNQAQLVGAFTDREADIQRLVNQVMQYREAASHLPRRREELSDSRHEMSKGFDALGNGWDEARIAELSDPAALGRKLTQIAKNLSNEQHAQAQVEFEVNARREAERKAQEAFDKAIQDRESLANIPDISANDLKIKQERIERLRAALADRDSVERDLRATNNQIADVRSRKTATGDYLPWWPHLIGFVFGVVLTAWGILSAESSGIAAGLIFAVLSISSWPLFRALKNRRQATVENSEPERVLASSRDTLATRLTSISSEIDTLLSELGYNDAPSERECVERMSEAGRDIRRREEYERLNQEAEDAEQQLAHDHGRVIEALSEVDGAKAQTDGAVRAWAEALRMASLPDNLDSGEALNAVSQLIELRGQLSSVNVLNERIDGIVRILSDVESKLGPVLEQAGLPGFLPEQATPALEDLAERFREHQSVVARVSFLRTQDDEWELDRQKLQSSLGEVDQRKELLLKRAGCANEEVFRPLAVQIAERHELERDLDSLHRSEPLLANEEGQPFRDELNITPEDAMRARQKELSEDIEREDNLLKLLYGDQRSLQIERLRLEESNPTGQIQQDIGLLQEEINEDAHRWAVLTIARTLLNDTKSQFQQQRQAPLLRTAGHHFSNFTLGRYPDVQRVPGEERIDIVDQSGLVKGTRGLSRGTAEQLYLAMRFALIDDHTQRSEPMPVLMDDVMVNFDENRRRAVCESLLEISKSHQVFVLTCHMSFVDQLRNAADAAAITLPNVIEI